MASLRDLNRWLKKPDNRGLLVFYGSVLSAIGTLLVFFDAKSWTHHGAKHSKVSTALGD